MWMPLPGRTRARSGDRPDSDAEMGAHAPVALTMTLARSSPISFVSRSRHATPVTSPVSSRRRMRLRPCGRRARARVAIHRVDHVGDAEARAVDAPLVERDAALEIAVDPRLELAELVGGEARVRLSVLERLVAVVRFEERVDELEEDLLPRPRLDRHQERDAEEQVRRDALDVPRVAAALLGDVRVVGEVARAAVDHAARVAARAVREVVALEQGDLQPAHRAVAGDARAVHAAAEDDDVDVDVAAARWSREGRVVAARQHASAYITAAEGRGRRRSGSVSPSRGSPT